MKRVMTHATLSGKPDVGLFALPCIVAAVLFLAPAVGLAATRHVDDALGDDTYEGEDIGSAEHPYKTIGKVFDLGSDILQDDEIVVHPGTYRLNGTSLVKNLYVLLRGETGNPADVVIDAVCASSCARFVGSNGSKKKIPFRIFGMTFVNGYASEGCCGVAVEANVCMSNCVIRACGSDSANAYPVYVNDATLVDCVISNCQVKVAPSAISIGTKGGTVEHCLISGNSSGSGTYAAIYAAAGGTIRDTVVSNCEAKVAVGVSGVPSEISGCTFVSNRMTLESSTREGGVVFLSPTGEGVAPSTTLVSDCRIVGNSAPSFQGAGLSVDGCPALVTGCTIESNETLRCAGVRAKTPTFETDSVTLRGCTIRGNVARSTDGGGAFLDNGVVAEDCVIEDNEASCCGGGVFGYGFTMRNCVIRGNRAKTGAGVCVVTNGVAAAKISGCRILDNTADRCGGGVSVGYIYGVATSLTNGYVEMSGCLVSNNCCNAANSDKDTYGGGGGVSLLSSGASAGLFDRCVFKSNRSAGYGGAFSTRGAGSSVTAVPATAVRSCLFDGNEATQNGGAMYLVQAGSLCVDNCTFGSNKAKTSSSPNDDTYVRWSGVRVRNCIFSAPRFDSNTIYQTAMLTNCLASGTLPSGWSSRGNFVDDPKLVDAAAGDWHLRSGSPCVNAGAFLDWMDHTSRDLGGRHRYDWSSERLSLGAYELVVKRGMALIFR